MGRGARGLGRGAPLKSAIADRREAISYSYFLFLPALGDPTRLSLLEILRGGERNVGELVAALGCPQPKVSRHLKVLKEAGLVRDTREGRNVAYALTAPRAWPVAARSWVERLDTGLPLRSEAPQKAPASPPPAPKPAAPLPARGQLESHLL